MSINIRLFGGKHDEAWYTITSPHDFPQALVFLDRDGKQELYELFQVNAKQGSEIAGASYRARPDDDEQPQ